MTSACDPGADDWLRHFFVIDDDGSSSVVWNPEQVGGDVVNDQFVRFLEAGDSLHDVVRSLREFTPVITATEAGDTDVETTSK